MSNFSVTNYWTTSRKNGTPELPEVDAAQASSRTFSTSGAASITSIKTAEVPTLRGGSPASGQSGAWADTALAKAKEEANQATLKDRLDSGATSLNRAVKSGTEFFSTTRQSLADSTANFRDGVKGVHNDIKGVITVAGKTVKWASTNVRDVLSLRDQLNAYTKDPTLAVAKDLGIDIAYARDLQLQASRLGVNNTNDSILKQLDGRIAAASYTMGSLESLGKIGDFKSGKTVAGNMAGTAGKISANLFKSPLYEFDFKEYSVQSPTPVADVTAYFDSLDPNWKRPYHLPDGLDATKLQTTNKSFSDMLRDPAKRLGAGDLGVLAFAAEYPPTTVGGELKACFPTVYRANTAVPNYQSVTPGR